MHIAAITTRGMSSSMRLCLHRAALLARSPAARPCQQLRYQSTSATKPLTGIKVVDLSRVLAGPLCAMMLADLGADVIKIESPGKGDDTRSWLPPHAEPPKDTSYPRSDLPPESAYFLQANRGKRSLTVNLKQRQGVELVHKLIKEGDVFVENYLPGKLKGFQLDYESVKAINPKIVYCSITGYGTTGPYAQNPGYDAVIQAEAGLMHITGSPGEHGEPTKVGVAVVDILTGHYALSSILAALYRRQETGEGCRVEASLFESAVASLANIGSNWLVAGKEAKRMGSGHPSIVPYQPFHTATPGSPIMIAVGNDSQFAALCSKVFMQPHLSEDPRFATNAQRVKNRHELVEILEKLFAAKSRDEWVTAFEGKGVPFAPINNIQQTFEHPQAIARGIVQEVEHERVGTLKLAGPAPMFDGAKPAISRPPPYLGQHTSEILAELGYSEDEVQKMQDDKVV